MLILPEAALGGLGGGGRLGGADLAALSLRVFSAISCGESTSSLSSLIFGSCEGADTFLTGGTGLVARLLVLVGGGGFGLGDIRGSVFA